MVGEEVSGWVVQGLKATKAYVTSENRGKPPRLNPTNVLKDGPGL